MNPFDCQSDAPLLKTIFNRPGLDKIDYRLGQYSAFRAQLMKSLNHDPVLAGWTHRDPDDPGIALLEGASILGDILTFYQDLYANEAFLRTAQWRDSIAELVRLTGYRLSPGVGGLASFAFAVTGSKAVTIPKAFPVKIQLEELKEVAEFETKESLIAYPGLSAFNLFRPLEDNLITKSTQEFYVDQVAGQLASLEFKAGDRLILGVMQSDYAGGQQFQYPEMVKIESVRQLHGKQVFKIQGALQSLNLQGTATAYKLGRTFNHAGHNSPPTKVSLDGSGNPQQTDVNFFRLCNRTTTNGPAASLDALHFPLDQQVSDLTAGTQVVCQQPFGHYHYQYTPADTHDWTGVKYELRTIVALEKASVTWGALTAAVTMMTLDKKLSDADDHTTGSYPYYRAMDIREMQFHEVLGQALTIKAVPQNVAGSTGDKLIFYGQEENALLLAKRALLLTTEEDEQLTLSVSSVEQDSTRFSEHADGWKVKLTTTVGLSDFEHDKPYYSVCANLVEADQGKTLAEVALGNGDARQSFQTFKIPKSPLTYLLDASATPPEVPPMTVTVDDEPWTWVPSLFNYGPKDKVFITREDESGTSFVQFGDGLTGARLSSGVKNVKAIYRQGVGAWGDKQEGAKPKAGTSLKGLDKIYMAGSAQLGSQAEEGGLAKESAPGKLQTLGRMVSLRDYEVEMLSISGVLKVRAAWALENNVALIKLWVLLEGNAYDKLADVRSLADTYNQQRGLNRYPLKVEPGWLQYVRLHAVVTIPKGANQNKVSAEIKAALGVTGEEDNGIDNPQGLFGLKARSFGQDGYANNVLAAIQDVKPVVQVELKSFHTMFYWPVWPENDDWIDSITYVQEVIPAPEHDVLALYTDHLKLQFVEQG